ncbi:hypothetical protein BC827DRAFT_1151863 [Russula dissimulans]|nr:hypothetical protein BC827DRAFT_1151863 [Russula dissimulans]
MLSWFNRNVPKPPLSHTNDAEPQQPHTAVAPSTVPEAKPSSQDPTHLTVAQPTLGTPLNRNGKTLHSGSHHPPRCRSRRTARPPPPPPRPRPVPARRRHASPSAPGTGMQSLDTLPATTSDVPVSIATSATSPPDALYEPFTGATIGFLSPTAKKVSEDLWAHLGRIRSLQADLARLHLTMEGVGGQAESAAAVAPLLQRSPGHSPPRAVGERLEDDDENGEGDGGAEAERRRARELERSERRFDERKEDIGQVMAKLDELSQALASFHAIDAPMFSSAGAPSRSIAMTPTPPRQPNPRHLNLHRISLGSSARGREDIFDSPASIQEPLPIVGDPESRVEPAQPDPPVEQ